VIVNMHGRTTIKIDEDFFIRRMPFRDQASIHINAVLIAVAVYSGEQNSHKKVASTCVAPNVWYRLSFFVSRKRH
jgi:hypothetical protein